MTTTTITAPLDALTDGDITERFTEAFEASESSDLAGDSSAEYVLASDDNTLALVNVLAVESFGCTELKDYRHVWGSLRPASVGERDVYALTVDGVECAYDRGRVEAIADVVGRSVDDLTLSAWKAAPSDVALLRIAVPGTAWTIILAPYMPGSGETIESESTESTESTEEGR